MLRPDARQIVQCLSYNAAFREDWMRYAVYLAFLQGQSPDRYAEIYAEQGLLNPKSKTQNRELALLNHELSIPCSVIQSPLKRYPRQDSHNNFGGSVDQASWHDVATKGLPLGIGDRHMQV